MIINSRCILVMYLINSARLVRGPWNFFRSAVAGPAPLPGGKAPLSGFKCAVRPGRGMVLGRCGWRGGFAAGAGRDVKAPGTQGLHRQGWWPPWKAVL